MSLGGLSLLFIGAVLLHNTEEALRLPRWSTRGLSWYPRLTRRPFVFAVCVLSLVLIACAAAAAWAGPDSVAAYLFVGYAFAMAANAVVPHLVGSLAAPSGGLQDDREVLLELRLPDEVLQRARAEADLLRQLLGLQGLGHQQLVSHG